MLDPHETSGGQGPDAAVQRVRIRHMPPKEETHVAGGVGGRVDVASGQKRLHLGCGTKDGSVITVIERLDAVGITG